MTRYLPARHYRWFGISAVALAGLCTWVGTELHLAYVPAGLFLLTAGLLFILAFRPAIEVHEGYVSVGGRIIPWMDIRRLDRTGWISPLIVPDHAVRRFAPAADLSRRPGFLQQPAASSAAPLARRPDRWHSVPAVLGRSAGARRRAQTTAPPPRYRILRPEDEAEVERLYQRLKTVGNLDQKNSTDEK